jgi:hypothetical protein
MTFFIKHLYFSKKTLVLTNGVIYFQNLLFKRKLVSLSFDTLNTSSWLYSKFTIISPLQQV